MPIRTSGVSENRMYLKSMYRRSMIVVCRLAVMIVVLSIIPVRKAQAHDFILDTTGKTGAILHFSPGDDPVAGRPSQIYYEVDSKTILKGARVRLEISSDNGGIVQNPQVVIKDQTVSSAYNFPVRGLYIMKLSILNDTKAELVFSSDQRVTESIKGVDPAHAASTWAMPGLLITVWFTTFLLLSALKRKRIILKNSR